MLAIEQTSWNWHLNQNPISACCSQVRNEQFLSSNCLLPGKISGSERSVGGEPVLRANLTDWLESIITTLWDNIKIGFKRSYSLELANKELKWKTVPWMLWNKDNTVDPGPSLHEACSVVRICPKEGQGLAEALLVYALKRKKPLASFICFSSEFKISSPVIARKGAIRSYEQTVKGILHKKKKKLLLASYSFYNCLHVKCYML